MKLGNYNAIEKETIVNDFHSYIQAIDLPFMDYIAIGVQDTIHMKSTSIMSNNEWKSIFKKLNLAEEDPLRKAAFNTRANYFTFDELSCNNNAAREVMRQRKLCGIENGMVFMKRDLTHNFILTLGTGFKSLNEYKYLIDYRKGILSTFDDLISMISPLTKNYRIKIKSRQDADAK